MTIGPDFVCVHVPRTASNAMSRLFLPLFGGAKVGKQHDRVVPPEHERKFTFTVVRNPYDRMLSCWHHAQRNSTNKAVAAMDFPEFMRLLPVGADVIRARDIPVVGNPSENWDESGSGQALFLSAARIDCVLRYENLIGEVATLPFNSKRIKWPEERLNAEARPRWQDEIAAKPEWAGVVEWHSNLDFARYGYGKWS